MDEYIKNMDGYMASQKEINGNLLKILKKLSGDVNKQENESEKNMDKNSKKNIPINKKNK